jgi:hypothetical protein
VAGVILAGSKSGVHLVEEDRTVDLGGPVTALASDGRMWAVVGDHDVAVSDDGTRWTPAGSVSDRAIRCLLPLGDQVIAGSSEAHLYRIQEGSAEQISSFASVEGPEGWYTPWGGPPDTRSLAAAPDGAIYANVHVGGIPKSTDDAHSWRPTIDVDADVHQVIAHGDLVLAACAPGLATSVDAGEAWSMDSEGLHGHYCRAVAAAGDTLLVSASTGPFTKQAAVYRRPLRSSGAFQKCEGGLPEWFGANIDSHCLVADGERFALGTAEGEVWISDGDGRTWDLAARGLPEISGLASL